MVIDALLKQVPAIARYRRSELAERGNALWYWGQAVDMMVPREPGWGGYPWSLDEGLGDVLPRAAGGLRGPPTGTGQRGGGEWFGQLTGRAGRGNRQQPAARFAAAEDWLTPNRRAVELLRAGSRCGAVQFPLPDQEGEAAQSAEWLTPLIGLASLWLWTAREQTTRGDLAAGVDELIGLGEMGHIIVTGEGLLVHYFIGHATSSMAAAEMQRIGPVVSRHIALRRRLADTLDRWLRQAGRVAQPLRVELCLCGLVELERFCRCPSVEQIVDQLLERHYANAPMAADEPAGDDGAAAEDDRLAWRRRQILAALEGHPEPFDAMSTARLLGRQVADRIRQLGRPRRWSPVGRWQSLARAYRRSRFQYRLQLWPAQLRAVFPYEWLGLGEAAQARLTQLRSQLTAERWARIQPPGEAEMRIVRQRLATIPNPLGVLVADAFLAADI
ncbi:MAG TPA: hypothetical protein EYP56_01695, partial [Planctomycetaceae bacterium]|nr:hypothetical protein [Planctomycetaceae bacterium]